MLKRRSSCVKVCSLVIVTVMLWPCAVGNTAAQETRKKSYDLSARKTGDVLKLRPEVWTEINRFVFMIAFDIYQPGVSVTYFKQSKQFYELDSYPKLYQACKRWGDATFPNLQRLAKELSTGDIRRLLTDMKSAADRWPNDPAGAERAFAVAADELMGKISEWERLSKDVKQDLEFLSTQTLAAAIQMKADKSPEARRIVDVRPELADVVAGLARVNDHWGALSSDLSTLRKDMATNLRSRDPFHLDITLDIGLTSWEAVEAAARTFMTNVPTQRRYLTGENYYDECELKENVWYLMQTLEFAMRYRTEPGYQERTALGTKILKGNGRPTYTILHGQGSGAGEPDANMQWRFERLGRGWLRIINRAEGDQKSLDISRNGIDFNEKHEMLKSLLQKGGFTPIVNQLALTDEFRHFGGDFISPIASQRWRCTRTGYGRYFQIYNAAVGGMYSLRMDSGKSNPWMLTYMGGSTNSPEEYWFVEAIPIK